MEKTTTLPLFPLHAALVPGALIVLRVFERRYLDLVRDCGRDGSGFGVCLILEGEEVGAPATPAAYGTEARIEDFDLGEDGLLALRLRGRRRFRVVRTRVRDNGLVMGEVVWCMPEDPARLRPEHAVLATVLEKILEQIDPAAGNIPPAQREDATWLGWRLAELLPISQGQRLQLLQEDDPHARLDSLLAWV
ncbi:ATP-dependent protease [Pseudoxanthomonas kalamensis DSM 18571]|uniref:LON peptidase substrate-binding domain-containing protein n=1 Tax=Pseudoxanthomonas kalamensis TaxID=289483 RepID=UPI001391C0BD|nr:LON peptidase substrate-binding domain-containing protein [Pseudoxanthomonas kalamensis]KAF1712052.1 ATP-dependent protease [Pseudoxanthomonas kalamensis DSM 18571]